MPHHSEGDQLRSTRRIWLTTTLITLAVSLLSTVLWTLPNWAIFSKNVSHFPALWQLESNRSVIMILVIKVIAPLLIAPLVLIGSWLFLTLRLILSEELSDKQRALTLTRQTRQSSPGRSRMVHGIRRAISPPLPKRGPATEAPPPLPGRSTPLSPQQAQHLSPCQPVVPSGQAPAEPRVVPLLSTLSPPQPAQEGPPPPNREQPGHLPKQPASEQEIYRPILTELSRSGSSPESSSLPLAVPLSTLQSAALPTDQLSAPLQNREGEYVRIWLLKEVRIELVAPDGRSALVPLAPSAKRVQLLAYLAWLRGEQVSREKLLEDVFGHGLPDEEATPKRLGEAFDSHRKFLRKDLREAITHLNAAAGTELLPVDLDVFSTRQRMWRLASTCRVIDLEAVVSSHQFIEAAHHDGRLANGVPEDVKRACDVLLKAYRGDFLEEMIRDFPADFDPWPSSWVRKPFTLFRDYYLQALWYSAEYELHQGLQLVDAPLEESRGEDASLRHLQREHYGRAAQLYQAYALHSVNHRFDTKLSFASFGQPGRAPGERVIMSERALRRAAQLYGWLGSPYLLDQLYTAYVKQMRRLSSDQWRPSQETLQTIEQARSYTSTAHLLL